MIHLEGEQRISQRKELVWSQLTNPSSMAKCIPGLEQIDYVDEQSVKGKVKLAVSFIKGTMTTHVKLHDLIPTSSMRMTAHSEGVGSSVDLEVTVELTENNEATHLRWATDVRLGGLLGRVSEGLLTKAADQLVKDTFERVKKQIEETQATAT